MFVNESRLLHVLKPEHYYSEDHHHRELERVLDPAWHPVASRGELRREGDYITLTLMGRPLLLRNMGGEIHTFLNVCAHRHCMLTEKAKGNDPNFRCQYHGWEYNQEGRTGKIPDAQSFRPFDRENARLKKFRTASCGEMVFVCLADEGPSLKEQLGEHHDHLAASFSEPWRQVWSWQADYPANWKIAIENLLESYHIPSLHPKTFKNYPEERNTFHEIHETWTLFRTNEMEPWVRKAIQKGTKSLGVPFTGFYSQWHIYPNLVFITMDSFRLVKVVVPVTPTTSWARVWVFSPFGPRRGIGAWITSRITAWVARDGARKILLEDLAVFQSAQQGMQNSVHTGVIGRREERVWAFQDWVRRHCYGPSSRIPLPEAPKVQHAELSNGCNGCNE